jgi:protein-tyrosine phosphatase
MRPPLSDEEADVVDPFRLADAVFEQMSAQIMDALPRVISALGPR